MADVLSDGDRAGLTPGPAVLLVVSTSLGRGPRPAAAAALGILAANALYFVLSATGVAAVLITSRALYEGLRWVGALYLMGLGLRMLLARQTDGAGGTLPAGDSALRRALVRGLVVQGANPKALIFFAALLPQFIDPGRSIAAQLWILGVSSVGIELLVLLLYAWAAFRVRHVAGSRIATALERLGGGLLVGAGLRLAAAKAE